MTSAAALTRRGFIQLGLTASGALCVYLNSPWPAARAAEGATALHPFVEIRPDNRVVIRFNRPEMGQGTTTSMPAIIADELDADWDQVDVEWAPVESAYLTDDLPYGVGGSGSVRGSLPHLRKIGAGLRLMFRRAAAAHWGVLVEEVTTSEGQVENAGRRLPYAQFVAEVAGAQFPDDPPLKEKSEFTIIGHRIPSRVTRACVTGDYRFGIDSGPDEALAGAVIRPPVPKSTVKSFDAVKALALPGVHKVVEIETNDGESGVGVIADTWWTAKKARELIDVEWNWGPAKGEDSAGLSRKLAAALDRPADLVPLEDESLARDLKGDGDVVEVEYEVPFEAHAALEPMTCTAHVTRTSCELWIPAQSADFSRSQAARLSGLGEDRVTVHMQPMGGSFGRKYTPDYIRDAVGLAKHADRAVRVIWSREDDMQHGLYRPNIRARLSALVGSDGLVDGLESRLAGPSFRIRNSARIAAIKDSGGFDSSTMEGVAPPFYPIPRVRAAQHWHDAGIPVMWWRSVANSFTAFFVESFLDELAVMAKTDPFDYRLALLRRDAAFPPRNLPRSRREDIGFDPTRMAALLEKLRAFDPPSGASDKTVGVGLACHYSFETYVAMTAHVRAEPGKAPRFEKAVAAVDCGLAVNPNSIEQQIQGATIFGASAALKGSITIRDGAVEQSNYHDFQAIRLADAPDIDVHIVASDLSPGGMGEPGVPPVAPAIANAIFRATGKRIRKLPIYADDLWA